MLNLLLNAATRLSVRIGKAKGFIWGMNQWAFILSSIVDNSLKLSLQIWLQTQSLGNNTNSLLFCFVYTGSGWQTYGICNIKMNHKRWSITVLKELMILHSLNCVLFWWFNNMKNYQYRCLQKQALSSWCLSFPVASTYKTHLFSAPKIKIFWKVGPTQAILVCYISWWLPPSI